MAPSPTGNSNLRCWAEIDLSALRHNASLCGELAGKNCQIMAIVKADAYGHGLDRVVTALANEVDWFGVANVAEAKRARLATGTEVPILILSPATPDEVEAIIQGRFSASVSSPEEVEAFEEAAGRLRATARLHAVADTGMGRMGAQPGAFPSLVESIRKAGHCRLEGVETHFPSADEDTEFTRAQIAEFSRLLEAVRGEENFQVHLGNSAGLIGFQELTPFATLTRPGLAIYGVSPFSNAPLDLQPVLSLKSRVTLIRDIPAGTSISYGRTFIAERDMRVATLGLGYGDGFPRHLSGSDADVLISGQRCRLLGRVTMDQIVVDISEVDSAIQPGDEVVLIGAQGSENISTVELAAKSGTIPWEILTGITSRVARIYVGS